MAHRSYTAVICHGKEGKKKWANRPVPHWAMVRSQLSI